MTRWLARARGPLRGPLALPGDKSISHRAWLVNTLGEGRATVRGANAGADLCSTREVLSALGVELGEGHVTGRGGRLRAPVGSLDCGNSGTTTRLLAGLLAAQPFSATLDGDDSLRARPMGRIARPLRTLGARVEGPTHGERLPLVITGGELAGASFELAVASAQLKSCLLLAAAAAGVGCELHEPGHSRDHTERMLAAMGADIDFGPGHATLRPGPALACVDVEVPGDPSAAALVAAAALGIPGSELRLDGMLLNPTRASVLGVLEEMGARVSVGGRREHAGEPVGDVVLAAPGPLRGIELDAALVPGLIDELPALAVLAATATGASRFPQVGELRVKESDRLAATLGLLAAFGVEARAEGEDLVVVGGDPRPPAGPLPASDDHRIAMAQAALGLAATARHGGAVEVELGAAAISFPGFAAALEGVGA